MEQSQALDPQLESAGLGQGSLMHPIRFFFRRASSVIK